MATEKGMMGGFISYKDTNYLSISKVTNQRFARHGTPAIPEKYHARDKARWKARKDIPGGVYGSCITKTNW
jgi:hypothetical protein